ncbi:MAG TPA: 30S ribosome-binding factor RbfA [Actinomycetota bacterium]|nr:30S ribosome-binding factor RbfA [Actinomycetota bacterium]
MPDGTRPSRVSEEFREILAEEIPKLKDPRIGFVTITEVRVTPDLRHCRVSYTALGDEKERKATAAGLRSARTHLRQVIGDQVRLKFLPDLEFLEVDLDQATRIDRLLEQVAKERAEAGDE